MFNLSRSLLTFVSLFLFLSCYSQEDSSSSDCVPKKERKCKCKEKPEIDEERQTSFPQHPKDDYNPIDYHVKIAVPIHADSSRVWVKGNMRDRFVQFFSNGQPISTVQQLSEPYYTAVISIPGDYTKVHVHFSDQQSDLVNSEKNVLCYPKNKAFLDDSDTNFSMLFYGCFQPFYVKKGESALLSDKRNSNLKMRQLFQIVGSEDTIIHELKGDTTNIVEPLIKNPKVVIGTGDQIYTDAGYQDGDFQNHPLSSWAHTCNNPLPLLTADNYARHLNRSYSSFNSFDCFQNVLTKLPSINVWDDHEIRDGWGSHGDEYISDGSINQSLDPYYRASRKAFIEHQYLTGPNIVNKALNIENEALHQISRINGKSIFTFDLRSNRNICQGQVISEQQLSDFKNWCDTLRENEEVIIISSIPMFYEQNNVSLDAAGIMTRGELNDDIADSWAFEVNSSQRNEIIKQLIRLRKRGIKPIIVSGDVHIGGMISVWYKNKETNGNERLCYEFIFSGLSHESLGEGRNAFKAGLQHRSEKTRVKDPTFRVGTSDIYPVYEFTRGRLNFGALEFEGDKTTASLFINGDGKDYIAKHELTLNWTESFEDYWSRMEVPFWWKINIWKYGKIRVPQIKWKIICFDNIKPQ